MGTANTTYIGGIQYAAHAVPSLINFGNGLYEQSCFNNRLQMNALRVGAQQSVTNCVAQTNDLLQIALDFQPGVKNNGNIWGVTQQVQSGGSLLSISQSMTYDRVNRLKTFSESGN